MRFWDSSGIVPLLVEEKASDVLMDRLSEDDGVVVWWGTSVECHSALNRRFREGAFPLEGLQTARVTLQGVLSRAFEVLPAEALRTLAHRLLAVHPLRGADSLQLAAALTWAEQQAQGRELVTLDERLRIAAQQEGFSVLPQ